MAKTQKDNPIDKLTDLLLRINKGEDPEILRKEANRVVLALAPKDVTSAENRLLDFGYSQKLVHQLSATFLLMGLFEIRKGNPRKDLAPGHIVYQISTEHDLIRCYMADLESVVGAINNADHLSDVSSEYRRLAHLAQHLVAITEHFAREREVIFPTLERYGLENRCREISTLHPDIEMAVKAVVNVTLNFKATKLADFKRQISDISSYLISAMLTVLAKEDNTLYAAALKIIDDEAVWKRMKWVCDDIGYCGVHA